MPAESERRHISGVEEFAFDLKNQKRATIVGETTGGGRVTGG
jgi:C-terminal processing protease CtpA/Prc